jgi:hypothetical protein
VQVDLFFSYARQRWRLVWFIGLCNGVSGLFSLIALIAWVHWVGVYSADR